jgi:hypothetical protein
MFCKVVGRSLLAAAMLLSVGVARANNYSLAGDWSDTKNPNGAWSLNSGSTAMTQYISDTNGNNIWDLDGSTNPSWNKVTTDSDGNTWLDRQAGDVIAQAAWYIPDRTNVTWTSPASGTITITGKSWDAFGDPDRDGDWTLQVNGITIAERTSIYEVTRDADGATFAENLLFGKTLDNINVAAGDVVMFSVGGRSTSGVEMSIAFAPAPEPSTLVLLGIAAIGLFAWRRRRQAA